MTPWGLARIEVIASKEHIAHELQRGVPVKQIHDALVNAGRVSVTYNSFRRQIRSIRDELNAMPVDITPHRPRRAPSTPAKQDAKQVPPPKTTHKSSGGFVFDPSAKAEDYF